MVNCDGGVPCFFSYNDRPPVELLTIGKRITFEGTILIEEDGEDHEGRIIYITAAELVASTGGTSTQPSSAKPPSDTYSTNSPDYIMTASELELEWDKYFGKRVRITGTVTFNGPTFLFLGETHVRAYFDSLISVRLNQTVTVEGTVVGGAHGAGSEGAVLTDCRLIAF